MLKKIAHGLMFLALTGCAGTQRSCASFRAENYASNWIVVQYDLQMHPANCWKLPSTSISNEEHTDGIYWLDPHGTHLVHISGWYNRVQISGGDWDQSAHLLGVDLQRCGDGKYQ